ncbi:MAG: redoxin domain-containing protein, partial [Bacteroidales bacterium]|nr:redoxin domain-containing protein [Bacteroidales bacterium]
MKRNLFLVFAIVLIATSCTSSAQKNSEDSSSADSSVETLVDDRQFLVKVGDTAPDFKMEMPDGSFVQLSELRGKVIMLQFTASWCGVCRKEMPHIEEQIWQKHKDNEEFALYGIDREEPVEKITMMREATGVTYPIGLDPDASIFGKYAENNAGITRNVIIDRDGKIVMLTRLYDEKE